MGSPYTGAWTPERLEALAEKWALGLSCSTIAAHLNLTEGVKISRNAVIGKVHRLGLPGRKAATAPGSRRPPPPRQPGRTNASLAASLGNIKRRANAGERPSAAEPQAPMPLLPPEAVGLNACLLPALTTGMCKWPINDPGRGRMDETLFCGDAVAEESHYCVGHRKRGLAPPSKQPAKGDRDLVRSLRRYA